MLTFLCQNCGFDKNVKEELAGKKVRCPKCKTVGRVPELLRQDQEIVAEFDETKSRTAANKTTERMEPIGWRNAKWGMSPQDVLGAR